MSMLDNTDAMGEKTLKQTLKNVFGLNMSTVTVLAICGILIATAVFEPTKTGAGLYEIIVNSLTTYISTMAINALMRDKSIRDAFALQSVQDVIGDFEKRVKRVFDHNEMEDLDRWCDEKNKANYEAQRKRILSAAGLDYKDFFEDGEYTGKEIHVPKLWYVFTRAWWLAVRQSRLWPRPVTSACPRSPRRCSPPRATMPTTSTAWAATSPPTRRRPPSHRQVARSY